MREVRRITLEERPLTPAARPSESLSLEFGQRLMHRETTRAEVTPECLPIRDALARAVNSSHNFFAQIDQHSTLQPLHSTSSDSFHIAQSSTQFVTDDS